MLQLRSIVVPNKNGICAILWAVEWRPNRTQAPVNVYSLNFKKDRQQAITQVNIDLELCHHIMSLGDSELTCGLIEDLLHTNADIFCNVYFTITRMMLRKCCWQWWAHIVLLMLEMLATPILRSTNHQVFMLLTNWMCCAPNQYWLNYIDLTGIKLVQKGRGNKIDTKPIAQLISP